MDATARIRPDGIALEESFPKIKSDYPDILFMADCSTARDGIFAEKLGFDLVGTTLAGYTEETKTRILPDYKLIQDPISKLNIPVVAEGGILSPEQMTKAFEKGAHCCVVGGAITRPRQITERFVESLPKYCCTER